MATDGYYTDGEISGSNREFHYAIWLSVLQNIEFRLLKYGSKAISIISIIIIILSSSLLLLSSLSFFLSQPTMNMTWFLLNTIVFLYFGQKQQLI